MSNLRWDLGNFVSLNCCRQTTNFGLSDLAKNWYFEKDCLDEGNCKTKRHYISLNARFSALKYKQCCQFWFLVFWATKWPISIFQAKVGNTEVENRLLRRNRFWWRRCGLSLQLPSFVLKIIESIGSLFNILESSLWILL